MSSRPRRRRWPPVPRGRWLTLAVALAAGLALVGATLAGYRESKEGANSATSQAEPAPPAIETEPVVPPPTTGAEPAAVPLSSAEYQAELTAEAAKVRRTLGRVAQARTYEELSTRVERAAAVVQSVAARLADLVPPEEAAEPHDRLVQGLHRLAVGLGRTAAKVDNRSLCAAPPVLARLGRLRAREPLRLATRQLRAKGYEVAGVVPKAVPRETRRLATGELVVRGDLSGSGQLTIDNGLDADGVVVLTRGKSVLASMYVKRHDIGTVGGIPDGTYRTYFTLGSDWDGELGRFTRDCSFARFDDPLRFESASAGGGIRFQSYTLTLHPVAGGAASVSDVAPDSFPGSG